MDLRNIMNNDASSAAKPPPPPPSLQQSPLRQNSESVITPRPNEYSTPGLSYQSNHFARPQPPSLQPTQHSPSASSAYSSTRSPFQYNSNLPPNGGTPSHYAQSPPPQPYQTRESNPLTPASPAVYTQPSLASPYTPQTNSATQQQQKQQQSYFNQYPASQPVHAAPIPQSSFTYPHASESPRPVNAQRPLQPQHISPPPPQRSQPSTPLGPPAGPYQRPLSQSTRPPSAGEGTPVQAANTWSPHDSHAPEQRTGYPQSYPAAPPPPREGRQAERPSQSQYPPESDSRERSVSISPKTIVSRQSLSQDRDPIAPHRTSIEDDRWRQSPSGSHSHSSSVAEHKYPSHPAQPDFPQRPQATQMSSSPMARHTPSREPSTLQLQPVKTEISETSELSGRPPKRKKMRYTEPPIFARRVPRAGKGPIIPNPRPPIPKHSPARFAVPSRATSVQRSVPSPSRSIQTPARLPPVNGTTPLNNRPIPPPQPQPTYGLLGPWEPSISGKIPYEEITKTVCDFLFKEVVLRHDIAAGAAGAAATGSGAMLEIEAKLGRIMDKDRQGRLRLPVMSECILQTEGSGYRTAFESSMSLAQHQAMNNFLNEAVKASMPQAGLNRIPLSYAHKRERDTFYEVPPQELPPLIQNYLNPRHKPKVRVTTDQKTGEILAKIIKCRLADLDVYSPRTNVDWRISVNIEMNYDGDVHNFPIASGGSQRPGGERIKDRMSYRHLAYQIDLTQVGTADSAIKKDFEHELEVEISAAEVRRQGELALNQVEANQYEELIKGFVDNVRFLARAVPAA
ncbi:mRNA-capping enzyme subunit beta [Talaromyces pinophilus]|nr:mRNA-capping enzyme subunit beta [Talaromyces pinophilus]